MLVWGSGAVLRDTGGRSRSPVLPPGIPNYSNSAIFPLSSNHSAEANNGAQFLQTLYHEGLCRKRAELTQIFLEQSRDGAAFF